MITREIVAQQLLRYLRHQLSLADLVDWAEQAILDGHFAPSDAPILVEITSRMGLADVENFGLLWEDCANWMDRLGYKLEVEARLAA